METAKIPYTKVPVNYQDLLNHWKSQGLKVENESRALHYLRFVGYYRLRGYAISFQEVLSDATKRKFSNETSFDEIIKLYRFDRALRTTTIDMLERIEIAFRCIISEMGCITGGSHWFLKEEFYSKIESAQEVLESLRAEFKEKDSKVGGAEMSCTVSKPVRSPSAETPVSEKRRFKHRFVEHYYDKYSEPDLPPSWMTFEALSFGSLSYVFSKLASRLRKDIAKTFDLGPDTLASWLWGLSYLRNLCAHHCRIWNRTFTIKSISDTSKLTGYGIFATAKFYHLACIIHYFLGFTKGASAWKGDLKALFEKYPEVDKIRMGFPKEWDRLAPWSE